MKDEYILASDDWSDIDVSSNSILIVYYDYRPEVLEIEERNEYGWKKRGEPKKYIAAHTWLENLTSSQDRKTSFYIGSLTEPFLIEANSEGFLYRKVIDWGSTGYIGRRETQEKQKVDAKNNPSYYDKNHGGMKGMYTQEKVINFEKVMKMARLLENRASKENQDNWQTLPRKDLRDKVKSGQIRKYGHKNKNEFRSILDNEYGGDTNKFWTAIILTPILVIDEPLIEWLNFNGNTRRDITLSSKKTTGIPYVVMTKEEYDSFSVEELQLLQEILNKEVDDLSDPGDDEQIISMVYNLVKDSGKNILVNALDRNDPIIKVLKEKRISHQKIYKSILPKVKNQIREETNSWIPEGYQHKTYSSRELEKIKEDFTKVVKLSDGTELTSFSVLSTGSKQNYDAWAENMSLWNKQKCPYNTITAIIHFPKAEGYWYWHDTLGEQVRNYLAVISKTYSQLTGRNINIEIKELEYKELKTDNAVIPLFADAAD